jgi:hypothetical protein
VYFYAGVDEEQKRYELVVTTWGKLGKPVCSDSSLCPFVLRDKDVPSLWIELSLSI